MGTTPAEAFRRLREAVEDGRLAAIVHRRELTLVTVFGSVVDDPANARDIDIAVAPRRGTSLDILAVINDFLWLTGSDDVDLLDLGRAGPVAREQALIYAELLHESEPGEYARAQVAASMERMDTEWLRHLGLRLMAEPGEFPRPFDPNFVNGQLGTIRELLDDLDQSAFGDVSALRRDRSRRHAIERILTRLVDRAVSINSHVIAAKLGHAPRSYRDSFELAAKCGLIPDEIATELAPSVGVRDLLVREHPEIDLGKVAAAVPLARAGYRRYVAVVAAFVTRS